MERFSILQEITIHQNDSGLAHYLEDGDKVKIILASLDTKAHILARPHLLSSGYIKSGLNITSGKKFDLFNQKICF